MHELGRSASGWRASPPGRAAGAAIPLGGRSGRPARAAGQSAAWIHARGVDLAGRLAESYGFRSAFFWQPLGLQQAHRGRRGGAAWARSAPTPRRGAPPTAPRARGSSAPVVDIERRARRGARAGDVRLRAHQRARGAGRWPRRLYERLRPQLRATGREARREHPRDQRLLPRLGGRARARRQARGGRPGGALHPQEARRALPDQRHPLLPRAGGVGPDGIDAVVYYDKPVTTFVRLLRTYLRVGPGRASRPSARPCPLWMRKKLWIPYLIERGPGRPRLPHARATCTSPSTTRATPPAPSSRRPSSRPRC